MNTNVTNYAQFAVQRRRFPRRSMDAAVAVCGVVSSSAQAWRGHCLNLSEGGAAVVVAGPWIPGQVVKMELTLGDALRPMQLTARVAHRNRLYCGLEFLATNDPAVTELRQLLAS
jgi:c-di-GMP-binding flagellar brake protein YcgR